MIQFVLLSAVAGVAYVQIDKHMNSIENAFKNEHKTLERRKRNMYHSQELVSTFESQIYIINAAVQVLKKDLSILIEEKKRLYSLGKRARFTFIFSPLISVIEKKITEGNNRIHLAKKTSSTLKKSLNDARYLLKLDTECMYSNMNTIESLRR